MQSNAHERMKRKLQEMFKSKYHNKEENKTNLMNFFTKDHSVGILFLGQSPYSTSSNSWDLDNDNINGNSGCVKSTKNHFKTTADDNKKRNVYEVSPSTSSMSNSSNLLESMSENSTTKGKSYQQSIENLISSSKPRTCTPSKLYLYTSYTKLVK
ncbi:hypothetical protein GQX74_012445 [Glossina fuscipes]|nr:hypothetical protein GQX74_012445 [Glossina fuscipes]